jgi:putative aminopeptidase FrvX
MANGEYYMGKAWDDRVGLALMIEALKRVQSRNHPNTILAVATVQEEVGLRGAHTSTALAEPDLGISLEVGVAADYPGIDAKQAQEALGKGPGIFLLDSSMIPNRRLRNFIVDVAQRNRIPFQYEVLLVTERMVRRSNVSAAEDPRSTSPCRHVTYILTSVFSVAKISTKQLNY